MFQIDLAALEAAEILFRGVIGQNPLNVISQLLRQSIIVQIKLLEDKLDAGGEGFIVEHIEGPLFGVFELSHDRTTGQFTYGHFLGLCSVGEEGQTEWISIERCETEAEHYAPAILALYDMDVFDTPIL